MSIESNEILSKKVMDCLVKKYKAIEKYSYVIIDDLEIHPEFDDNSLKFIVQTLEDRDVGLYPLALMEVYSNKSIQLADYDDIKDEEDIVEFLEEITKSIQVCLKTTHAVTEVFEIGHEMDLKDAFASLLANDWKEISSEMSELGEELNKGLLGSADEQKVAEKAAEVLKKLQKLIESDGADKLLL